MKQIALIGNTQKIELEGLDRPQFLTFSKISVGAKISCVIERVGAKNNEKVFTPIDISKALESQKKIALLENGVPFSVTKIFPQSSDEFAPNLLNVATLQVAIGGEIPLGNNDKIVINMSNMNGVGGTLTVRGSKGKISTNYYRFLDEIFEANHREKRMNVQDYSYLVFGTRETEFPEKIEMFAGQDKLVETYSSVLENSEHLFGLIASSQNEGGLFFGTKDAMVVDVRGVQELTLYNEANQVINFHGVKF